MNVRPAVVSGEKGTLSPDKSGFIVTPDAAPVNKDPASSPGAYTSYS